MNLNRPFCGKDTSQLSRLVCNIFKKYFSQIPKQLQNILHALLALLLVVTVQSRSYTQCEQKCQGNYQMCEQIANNMADMFTCKYSYKKCIKVCDDTKKKNDYYFHDRDSRYFNDDGNTKWIEIVPDRR